VISLPLIVQDERVPDPAGDFCFDETGAAGRAADRPPKTVERIEEEQRPDTWCHVK
jgi:hypothetical protein